MYKKKISTIAIITILTLSILLAAIPMALAAPPISAPTLSKTSGPVGTKITVSTTDGTATAFGLVEVYWDTLATKIKDGYATSAGNYSIANVFIPEDIAGAHEIIVYDTLSSTINSTTFTITSEIKLSTPKGLPGDSVTVTGTGFGNKKDVYTYLNATAVTAESVSLSGSTAGTVPIANVTGTLGNTPIVKSPPLTNISLTVNATTLSVFDDGAGNLYGDTIIGAYDVNATGTMNYATGFFNVTVNANATTYLTISSASADYTHYLHDVTPALGTTTSSLGSFSAVILIPAIAEGAYGAYTVMSIDEAENSDTATLTVDYYITVTPPTGPTGITVTIAGRIEASKAYELRFNAAPIATGTSASDGAFSNTYVIPAVLSVASYPVDVVWSVTKQKSATFNVTAPPQVVFTPTSGVAGAVIKISTVAGYPFSAGANITLYLGTTVVNSTATDDRFGPTNAFTGAFTDLEFTVPALTPGPYALKVVDEFGASTTAIYTFTVLPTPVTTAELRGTSYYPCCTLSFNIVTTETDLVPITVTIRDPAGAIWWTTAAWTLTGTVSKSVYYQDQLVNGHPIKLPLDAPLGSWNWTVTYTPVSTGILTTSTGLFTVAAEPSQQDVLDQLDIMEASIKSVITTSEGKIIVAINTKAGEIITDLDALGAKLQGIEDVGVIIATDVDEIQLDLAALDLTVLDALGIDITSIKGDVATIKSNIGTVTTSVSTLDAKVTSLSGDVATVSTTLGTLTGTVTSIDGKVATIDTDVGTLQADISAVQADVSDIKPADMTPAWIAVVLSLVAAIAAIFAVITIRQKIAG